MTKDDLTARGNFATIDGNGIIVDRRAGRISTKKNKEACQFLQSKIREVNGIKVAIYPGKEHRFVIVFRGEGLKDDLTDADPQKDGLTGKETEGVSSEEDTTSALG